MTRTTIMTPSPYVEAAHRLLDPNARTWEEPTRCREIAARLRLDGEDDLAARLEKAAQKPLSWPGSSADG